MLPVSAMARRSGGDAILRIAARCSAVASTVAARDDLAARGVRTLTDLFRLVSNIKAPVRTRATACWFASRVSTRTSQAAVALGDTLADRSARVRYAGVLGLAAILPRLRMRKQVSRYVTELMRLLDDKSLEVRCAAVHALGQVAHPRGVRRLTAALQNVADHPKIRGLAAESLGLIGDVRSRPRLRQALEDPSPEVRFFSVFALGEMRDKLAIPYLRRMLDDTTRIDGYGTIAREAANAIVKIRSGRRR